MNRRVIGLICLLILTGILACQLGTTTQTPFRTATITTQAVIPSDTPLSPDLYYTAAAATVWAALTQTAAAIPSATPSAKISTVTPTLTLPLVIYDGEWEGLTKLGLPVSFRIEDNFVTYFAAEYDTPDCHVKVEPDLPGFGIIENSSFSMGSGGSALLGYRWHFEGTFISSSKATGKFSAFMGSCGSVDTTWEASRK